MSICCVYVASMCSVVVIVVVGVGVGEGGSGGADCYDTRAIKLSIRMMNEIQEALLAKSMTIERVMIAIHTCMLPNTVDHKHAYTYPFTTLEQIIICILLLRAILDTNQQLKQPPINTFLLHKHTQILVKLTQASSTTALQHSYSHYSLYI